MAGLPAGRCFARSRLRVLLLLLAVAAVPAAGSAELAPARGRFLVAERGLDDPNFAETVVLLVDYDASGAMGLIVNWPTAAPAAELLPEIDGIAERAGMVWVGGPVERRLVLMLMRSEAELPQAEQILAGVHLSTSNELLRQVTSGELEVGELRLYSGYAGWAPGQLDLELAVGGWRVVPAEADLVFHPDPDRLWSVLMERAGVQWTWRSTPGGVPAAP